MKTIIENTILVITVIIISTLMITSINRADTYLDGINEKTSEQKWEAQQRVERLMEGRN